MANKAGGFRPALTDADHEATRAAFHEHGTVRKAAAALGIERVSMRYRIDAAAAAGFLEPRAREANDPARRSFQELRAARMAEYDRSRAKGDWRKPYLRTLGPCQPFVMVILGDPHLDNPGTDLALWERWTGVLDRARRVWGVCIGDYLDNWPRVLGFLYGEAGVTQSEGWELLEGYLDHAAPHMLGSVGGNHDDWNGAGELLARMFRERGVKHRPNGLRLALHFEGRDDLIYIGLRHKFRGQSQWNAAHAVMKAAQMGYSDHVLAAGHIHQSGDGRVVAPDTGRVTYCVQIAAFKRVDSYADREGFTNRHISPAVALLIDPRRRDDDPELVHPYYCAEAAVAALEALK